MLQSATKGMRRKLFGKRGYGLDVTGSETSVRTVTRQQLLDFYRELTIPNNCVMSIFGDISAKEVKAAVEEAMKMMKKRPATKKTGAHNRT